MDAMTYKYCVYLYIYDSKTNVSQGPSRLNGSYSDMRLVYGPNSTQDQDPQFGILASGSDHFTIDLRSVNSSTLSLTKISDTFVVSENLKSLKPPPQLCGESCEFGKQLRVLIAVVLVVVVVGLVGIYFLVRYCFRKKKRLRPGALASTKTRRPGNGDVDLPLDTTNVEHPKAGV
ncbi:hypothetical protein CPB97_012089 [Podila verticillata]|nr:hypothetical protein CPB97_012089 [Podila verticillata]